MTQNIRWKEQLNEILERFNENHASQSKVISHSTRQARSQGLHRAFSLLRELGFKPEPGNLAGRHVTALVAYWAAQPEPPGLEPEMPATIRRLARPHSAAYIQQQLSFLRVYAAWIGKPGLVRSAEHYVTDPKVVRRGYAALEDKGWESHGVPVEPLLARVSALDAHVGGQLRMMIAFGLRRKEAVMFCPHLAEVPAYALPARQHALENYVAFLRVHRGTKGGRLRYAAVRTEHQRQALEIARSLVRHEGAHIGHPGLSLKQSLDLFSNVVRAVGLTKNELGVTPHGLRHQFAGDLYFEIAHVQPPVRGGDPFPDRVVMEEAYRQVAQQLGHNRPHISSAYLGSPVSARGPASECLEALP